MSFAGPNRFIALFLATFIIAISGALPTMATASDARPADESGDLDVDYVPTPMEAVRRMLEMAQVGPDDRVVDLGSGDGRILITAALEHGVSNAIGIELDPWLHRFASRQANEAGVADRIRFIQGDLFEFDFSDADVLTMYLLPELNLRLRPYILEHLAPGTRIVSHAFDMGEWTPDAQETVFLNRIYLWIVPARVAGVWKIERESAAPKKLFLTQQFQHVSGHARVDGQKHPLTQIRLVGNTLNFSVKGNDYVASVDGDTLRPQGDRKWLGTRVEADVAVTYAR